MNVMQHTTGNAAARRKKIPRKYHPQGFEVLYEDDHLIVGNKAAGLLSVAAPYDRERTVHQFLNEYVRKGNSRSRKCVFPVHRLDRETSGVLLFAKTEQAQCSLKDHWKETEKTYMTVVHGRLAQKSGTISSYLVEDDKYRMHSFADDVEKGKLAHTAYTVIKEAGQFSVLKISLLTGRKNQIRVHLAHHGHPVVGDAKYGRPDTRYPRLALHAHVLAFTHPATGERLTFTAPVPEHFYALAGRW